MFRRVDDAIAAAGVGGRHGRARRGISVPARQPLSRELRRRGDERRAVRRVDEPHGRARPRRRTPSRSPTCPRTQAEALGHALWDIDRQLRVDRAGAGRIARRGSPPPISPTRSGARRCARAARVPDDYATWQRVAGLYWLTRIPFASGITPVARGGARDVRAAARCAAGGGPPCNATRRRRARSARGARRVACARLGQPARRYPSRAAPTSTLLFRAYRARVRRGHRAAMPTSPASSAGARTACRRSSRNGPVVYRRVSHARYQGRALLQLNYSIWFPERPEGGRLGHPGRASRRRAVARDARAGRRAVGIRLDAPVRLLSPVFPDRAGRAESAARYAGRNRVRAAGPAARRTRARASRCGSRRARTTCSASSCADTGAGRARNMSSRKTTRCARCRCRAAAGAACSGPTASCPAPSAASAGCSGRWACPSPARCGSGGGTPPPSSGGGISTIRSSLSVISTLKECDSDIA